MAHMVGRESDCSILCPHENAAPILSGTQKDVVGPRFHKQGDPAATLYTILLLGTPKNVSLTLPS